MAAFVAVVALAGASCGQSTDEPEQASQESGPAVNLDRPAEKCPGAARVTDPPDDMRNYVSPDPPGPGPERPSGDLRAFELRAGPDGVCARWTTAEPLVAGSSVVLVAHGMPQDLPAGGSIAHGHGFDVELSENDAQVTYGLDRRGSRAPRVLEARVGMTGRALSVFVPHSELDRPPANMPGRPPFPHEAFTVAPRVLGPMGPSGQSADFWPPERRGEATYADGRLTARR